MKVLLERIPLPRLDPLVGMPHERFPAKGAMTVTDPEFFLFADTGVRKGSSCPACWA
ncbi:hypothetical protein [Mariniluteicoccus endophyticus]